MNKDLKCFEQYNSMNDEDIIKDIAFGDNNALDYIINKYNNLVTMKASKFFINGSEKEDVIQEGLIGLYKAVQSYNDTKDCSFKTFANMCIERQMITAVKTAGRQKNIPLNSAVSLSLPIFNNDNNDESESLIDKIDSKLATNPLDEIIQKEYYDYFEKKLDESLSEHERKVLFYYKRKKKYSEIAEKLNCNSKSVDTAITRIRKKANKIKEEMEKNSN